MPASRWPNCIVIIAASSAITATSEASATHSDCEWKKLVSSRKKHRKITTKRSRLARISISFRPRNSTSSATPASRPSSVSYCTMTATVQATAASSRTGVPGRPRPENTSPSRHPNSSRKPALHQ